MLYARRHRFCDVCICRWFVLEVDPPPVGPVLRYYTGADKKVFKGTIPLKQSEINAYFLKAGLSTTLNPTPTSLLIFDRVVIWVLGYWFVGLLVELLCTCFLFDVLFFK